jgi:hypothetical protein
VKNGIIMEINRRFLTVLTPDGEFLQVRRQDQLYQVGQEINFSAKELEKKLVPFSIPIKFAITACAFVLVLISIIPVYQDNQVYAYMSIDINPSIELGMNENLKVIELMPYNKDGEKIVNALSNWKRKDVDKVTLEIMNEINKQGYTKKKNEVVVSTVLVKDQRNDTNKLQEEIKVIEKEIAKENLDMILVEASEKDREKAKEKGITTGLYKGNSNNQKDSEKDNMKAVKQEEKTSIEPPHNQQIKVKPAENQEVFIPKGEVNKEERKEKSRTSDTVRNKKDYSNNEEKREQKRQEKAQQKIEHKQIPKQNQFNDKGNQSNKDRNNGKELRDDDNRHDQKQRDKMQDQSHNNNQRDRSVDKHYKSNHNNKYEDHRKKDKHGDRNEQKNR